MLKYIIEINAPWVMEVISEQFDDVLNRLPSTAIIYGGAVRDVLAKKPLKGDLDIAVPGPHYSDLVREFDRAVKWRSGKVDSATIEALTNIPIKEDKKAKVDGGLIGDSEDFLDRSSSAKHMHSASYGSGQDRGLSVHKIKTMTAPSFSRTKSTNYKFGSSLPLSHIATFVTFNNKEIQIISSKSTGNELEDSIYIARHVDIICCGVIMTTDGKVYEVVKGAYEDCLQNILRFNDFEDNIVNINRLKERIIKLTERGWKSEINIKKLTTVINKRNALLKKKEKAILLKQLKQSGLVSPKAFRIEKEQYDACGGIGPAKSIFFDILTRNNIFCGDFKVTKTSKGYTFTDKKNRGTDTLIQIKKVFEQALVNKKDNKTTHLKTLIFELCNIEGALAHTGLNIRDIVGNLLGSTFIMPEAIRSSNLFKSKHALLSQIQKAVNAIPGISLHNLQKCIINADEASKPIQEICDLITKSDLNHYFPVKKPSVTRAVIPELRANKNGNYDGKAYGYHQGRTNKTEPLIEESPVVMATNFFEGAISTPVTGRASSTKVNTTKVTKSAMTDELKAALNESPTTPFVKTKTTKTTKKATKTSKTNLW